MISVISISPLSNTPLLSWFSSEISTISTGPEDSSRLNVRKKDKKPAEELKGIKNILMGKGAEIIKVRNMLTRERSD